MKNNRIIIFSNSVNSVYNFRYDLILDLLSKKYNLFIIAPDFNEDNSKSLNKINVKTINLVFKRTSLNIFNEIINLYRAKKIIKNIDPSIILNFSIKPIIYGSLIKLIKQNIKVISVFEGRGYLYLEELDKSIKIIIVRLFLNYFLKIIFFLNHKVIFLNKEDKKYFSDRNIFFKHKFTLLPSIGVNLNKFKKDNLIIKANKPLIKFIFVGRLLLSKGINEFVNAAKFLKIKYPNSQFIVIGGIDENPNSISKQKIDESINNNYIKWTGNVNNVKEYLDDSDVFVLPTYYREGVPKSILEAMAMSMPILTTNTPGCSETVIEGFNGYFVKSRDSEDLINKMEKFLINNDIINEMGKKSRILAEKKFDVKIINRTFINFFN